jgi:hypothetical protein
LDRVFVSTGWETLFLVTHISLDHCPLILDNGEKGMKRSDRFFQTWWFGVPGFGELVKEKIQLVTAASEPHQCPIEG